MSIYLSLTRAFNKGALRAILSLKKTNREKDYAVIGCRLAQALARARAADTGDPLLEAHEIIAQHAAGALPFRPLESPS